MSGRSSLAPFLFLGAALLSLQGCSWLGFASYAVSGPQKVEAQHPLRAVPTLVLVEPTNGRAATSAMAGVDADRLARMIGRQLTEQKVVPSVVDNDQLVMLRDATLNDFKKMSVAQVGRRLGAEQVIYVQLDIVMVGTSPGSEALRGAAATHVRVVDVATQSVLWPADSADSGAGVAFEVPFRQSGDRTSPSSIRAETLQGLADRIAKLFYTWSPEDETGQTLR